LLRFAAGREAPIAAMETPLGQPGVINHRRGRAPLAMPERVADEGVMAIVPGGFDQDPTEMRVAGFGDRAMHLFRTT